MKLFGYEELVKATMNFSESRFIGKGSHGCVYKGMLEDGTFIAIKKQSFQDNSKIKNEVSILSSLSENSFIVNLVGTSHDSTVLVMEYLPNGTLYEMLHAANHVPPNWRKRAQLAIQLAKAVQFLHQAKPTSIIHRDIKSANVLFDSNWNAKLADLGLACEDHEDGSPRPAGTIGYLDPGYTKPSKLSTKNDIFSFGVLLLEIMSSRKVIDVTKSPVSIVDWATSLSKGHVLDICDKRVHMPFYMEGTIKNMLNIATRCVSPKKSSRPSIQEIVMEMEPIKYPLWSILRSLTLLKRKRKKSVRHEDMDMSRRNKLLIREILTEE